jgi:hypothetical protein
MRIEDFIGKEKINGEDIRIPEDAKYIRMKKGYVKFFIKKSKNNSFIKIPKNAMAVSFPEYREHCYHIEYGRPSFKRK